MFFLYCNILGLRLWGSIGSVFLNFFFIPIFKKWKNPAWHPGSGPVQFFWKFYCEAKKEKTMKQNSINKLSQTRLPKQYSNQKHEFSVGSFFENLESGSSTRLFFMSGCDYRFKNMFSFLDIGTLLDDTGTGIKMKKEFLFFYY